jgi:branched-subunit amino acid ABC-type transport system permease component
VDTLSNFLDLVVSGILASSVVAVMALSLSLVYRTTGILNLSQGALAALGGYVAYAASSRMPMALAIALAIMVAATVGALLGLGIETRLSRHSAVIAMVATLAAGVVLSQLEQQIWGPTPPFPNVIGLLPVRSGGFVLDRVDLWATAAAVGLSIALTLFLLYTRWGLALRAVSDSTDGARISGIPALRIQLMGWALASGLAAVCGFFVATPMGLLSPDFMNLYMVAALIAAVVGGLGNLTGAVIGAIAVSVARSLYASYVPMWIVGTKMIFLGSYTQTLTLLLLIAVLLLRPRGLLGGRLGREV